MAPGKLAETFVTVATARKVGSMPELPDNARTVSVSAGPIDAFQLAKALAGILTARQFSQLLLGLIALRTAWSSAATESLVLRLVEQDELARTEISSDAVLDELDSGGISIAMLTRLDLQTRKGGGRTVYSPVQISLRDALAMSVSRIDALGATGGDDDRHSALYDAARSEIATALRPLAGYLFNLNRSHNGNEAVSARTWCEREGPVLLVQAHGGEGVLEHQLPVAMAARVRSIGFEQALDRELTYLKTIAAWAQAHRLRREGEKSRADTIKRAHRRGASGQMAEHDAPKVEAPRIHNPVRRSLLAQQRLGDLSPSMMTELCLLFGLEPAHEVFPSRRFLLPVLAAAAFAGRLALRRQNAVIADPVTACGLLALVEMRQPEFSRPVDPPSQDPDIMALHAIIASVLARAGLSLETLAEAARRYLDHEAPITVGAIPGPPSFFAG